MGIILYSNNIRLILFTQHTELLKLIIELWWNYFLPTIWLRNYSLREWNLIIKQMSAKLARKLATTTLV